MALAAVVISVACLLSAIATSRSQSLLGVSLLLLITLFGTAVWVRDAPGSVWSNPFYAFGSLVTVCFDSLFPILEFDARSGAPTTGGRSDMQSGLLPVTVLAGWFVTTLVATAVVHSARRVS
jgi:hypothetical protein